MQEVANGHSDREISEHLHLLIGTVKHSLKQVHPEPNTYIRTRVTISLALIDLLKRPKPLLPVTK